MKRLTIYDIKRMSAETAPHFFTRDTLRFFHQTLKDFSVYKLDGGKTWKIVAEMRDYRGKLMGYTVRYFDTHSRQLLRESEYTDIQELHRSWEVETRKRADALNRFYEVNP